MLFVALLLLGCVAAQLQPQTFSEVCPALTFSHDWNEEDGNYFIDFLPRAPFSREPMWVDVHVVLFDTANNRPVPGAQKNIRMDNVMRGARKTYTAQVVDETIVQNFKAKYPDNKRYVVKYSFTYCVDTPNGAVDCDTGIFDVIPVTFGWRGGLAECPTDCGLPASAIELPVRCMGSDGNEYGPQYCANMARPAPLQCPATEPCVSYGWATLPAQCPTACGLSASTIEQPVVCMGSDGNEYGPQYCSNMARPAPLRCPATEPCESFEWRASSVGCPTECGLPAQMIEPALSCVSDTGAIVNFDACDPAYMPQALDCPATEPCYVEPVLPVVHQLPSFQLRKGGKHGKHGLPSLPRMPLPLKHGHGFGGGKHGGARIGGKHGKHGGGIGGGAIGGAGGYGVGGYGVGGYRVGGFGAGALLGGGRFSRGGYGVGNRYGGNRYGGNRYGFRG